MTTRTKKKRKTTTSDRRRHGQRGVALILVLWTFAAVAVLAAEFARAMHDEAASTRNFKESTAARLVAIAGLNEVILALQADRKIADTGVEDEDENLDNPDPIRTLDRGDGQWVKSLSWQGHDYEARVIDEQGKLGLNKVSSATLLAMFENLDIDENDAEIIADSIVDWRDPDDLHGANGAESEYYESLERPYRCKNASFDTVEELLLVRGVTRELFYGTEDRPGLKELFSIINTASAYNPGTATPGLIQALGGFDAKAAGELSDARRQSGSTASAELRAASNVPGARALSDKAKPQKVTIEVRVHDASGTLVLAHIGAALNLSSSGDELQLYRWYDSIFDESDQSGGTPDAEVAAS